MNATAHLIALMLTGFLLVTANARADDKLNAEAEAGFVSLFDGKTLDGWTVMNGGKFVAADGVIKLNGGSGWLRSNKQYTDFVLRLEVRWMKPKQDSGVFLRASEEGNNWPNRRYEVQCENSERVAKIFGAKEERDVELATSLLKDVGEWQTYEIRCIGKRLEVIFNGKPVNTSDALEVRSGYIGLQGEGGMLEFRNLRIMNTK
jgi:hypothetical protein